MTTGRNFAEILRVIDLAAVDGETSRRHAEADWQQGGDVIIAGSVTDDEAKTIYPQGWKAPKPYIPDRAAAGEVTLAVLPPGSLPASAGD